MAGPGRTAPEATRSEVTLAQGTEFETTCHVFGSGQDGPTVLVLAGLHGDEPAPPLAARRIATWTVERGRLLVVPVVNQPAARSATRHVSATVPVDVNRLFPPGGHVASGGEIAEAIWSLLSTERVSWLLDLHEGWDYHLVNPKSVGSSVTFVRGARAGEASAAMARRVLEAINLGARPPKHRFTLISPGPAKSVARAAAEELGLASLVIETTKIGQPTEVRVHQHETAVRAALEQLGMGPVAP